MKEKLLKIINKLDEIEYGWVDNFGVIHKNSKRDFFIKNYRLQTIEETLNYKVGTCWEQVELARYYLEKENIEVDTYIIIYNDDSKIARHTIAVVKNNNKFYWMESSWNIENHKFEFNSLEEILNLLVSMFPQMYKIKDFDMSKIEIYKYPKPEEKMSFEEFTSFCRKKEKIDIIKQS